MERGQGYRYVEGYISPISFFPPDSILYKYPIQEELVDITDDILKGVYPWYQISNYGRIWHKYLGEFLNINIDSKGYSYKPLAGINGPIVARVHRLVLLAFNPVENSDKLVVNHIDANKLNNIITNLEWTTYSGNTIHAYNNNLIALSHKCMYDDPNLVHAICRELQDDKPISYIAETLNVPVHIIEDIKYKKSHKEISNLYTFKTKAYKNHLSENDIRGICEFYTKNIQDPKNVRKIYVDALRSIGLEDPDPNFILTAQRIYSRRIYNNITSDYVW